MPVQINPKRSKQDIASPLDVATPAPTAVGVLDFHIDFEPRVPLRRSTRPCTESVLV